MLLLLKLLRSILLNILAYLNFQSLRGLRQIFDWLSTHQIQNLISSLYSSYVPKYELDTAIYGERLLFFPHSVHIQVYTDLIKSCISVCFTR